MRCGHCGAVLADSDKPCAVCGTLVGAARGDTPVTGERRATGGLPVKPLTGLAYGLPVMPDFHVREAVMFQADPVSPPRYGYHPVDLPPAPPRRSHHAGRWAIALAIVLVLVVAIMSLYVLVPNMPLIPFEIPSFTVHWPW